VPFQIRPPHIASIRNNFTATDRQLWMLTPNVGAHPRRLRRASAAGGVGCSAVLAGFIDHVSTGMSR